ncbi:DUF2059 domain-containing protein [Flammeovirga pacifica]|uniref:DUF2059 domain-containing protein n=1 Tax=Flammeovirga pacifica TaxID=915059 RepID=A0A1S1Z181_FLAPC|nr:hypothetical protein [Flammeovirga pacifica]OHX67002.1 hypothetical protein NH26_11935 [Flammeovirga pacifica]
MNKSTLFLLITLFVINLSSIAQTSSKLVTQLMEESGTAAQFDQLDQMIDAQIAQSTAQMSPEMIESFTKVIKTSMNGAAMKKSYHDYFTKNCSEDTVKMILDLYKKPLVVKAKKMEVASQDPANQADQMQFFQNLQANPPAEERILLIATLNQELGTMEIMAELLSNMMYAMMKGANSVAPEGEQMTDDQLRAQIAQALPPMAIQQIQQQIIAVSIYTYKDMSNDEIKDYTQIWATKEGKSFIRNSKNAFNYSFEAVGEKIGKTIVK